jgi:hypothetical protein
VFIVRDASNITELHHLRQYAEPDAEHELGKVYCGRTYQPAKPPERGGSGGGQVSPGVSGEIWVNLEALARDEGESRIGGLIFNAGRLATKARNKILRMYESSNNPHAVPLMDHLKAGVSYIEDASASNATFINQLNDYLATNPFTNPSGIEPVLFNSYAEGARDSHRTGAVHSTMGTVNEHLQQEVDRVRSASDILENADAWAEIRSTLFNSLVGEKPSNDNLRNASDAALACAGFASQSLRHLIEAREIMVHVRL